MVSFGIAFWYNSFQHSAQNCNVYVQTRVSFETLHIMYDFSTDRVIYSQQHTDYQSKILLLYRHLFSHRHT
jgi:hypothetical protein